MPRKRPAVVPVLAQPGARATRCLRIGGLLLLCLFSGNALLHAQGTLRGQVVDDDTGAPLPTAQVHLPGLDLGAITNATGGFLLLNVPAGTHTVRVQRIGYGAVTQQITIATGQTALLNVRMKLAALALDEVVVTGTAGQARRREVGNTITQVNLEDVVESPPNVEALLQGRAAGVNVTQNSGQAGDGAKIRLRGNVSAALSNQPLVYIDGVRVRSDGYGNVVPITGGQQYGNYQSSSPLNDISPNDIERIEIIKGAAATTLYGTEAAAGVIQIFTKRGQSGAPQWNLQVDQGAVMKNKFGFRETLRGTPISDFGVVSPTGGRPEYMFLDPWFQNGWRQNYVLSVRGGTQGVRYFVSGTAENNEGLFVTEGEEKYGIRGNLGISLTSNLTFDWNTSYTSNSIDNVLCGNSINGLCLNAFRAPYNYLASGDFEDVNSLLDGRTVTNIGRLITGATLNYNPVENLTSKLTVGYDRADFSGRISMPFAHLLVPEGNQSSTEQTAEILTLDFASTYALELRSNLGVDLSAGFQTSTSENAQIRADAEKFPGPGLPTLSSGAITLARESRERVITGGFFGQALFKFWDRYFLTAGLRVDGNSAFGDEFGLQPYPKVNASWVVSDESFWPELLGTLKVRAAYGEAGRAPGAFDAVRTWTPVSWGSESAFIPRNPGNPTLGPERSREIEAGFESAHLDGRLTLDFTIYRQKTTDALLAVNRPVSAGGWASQLENVGELENKGFELAVNSTPVRSAAVTWALGVNVSTNQSKVLSLGGAPEFGSGGGTRIVLGQPVPVVRGDLLLNPDEKANPKFEANHNFGPNVPTLIVNPHTSLDLPYGVTINARGEYQGGHYIRDAGTTWGSLTGARMPPCYDALADIEAGRAGNLSALERAWCIRQNHRSGWYVYPADFFKLREVSVQVPITRLVPRSTGATLTLSGRNMFRWVNDDFRGWDPEQGGWNGINSFAADMWEKPAPGKILTASVRLSF